MEYARVKVLSLRRRLCEEQKGVLDLACRHGTSDYEHPAVRVAYQRALITEGLLDEWVQRYREECKSSVGAKHGLNTSK